MLDQRRLPGEEISHTYTDYREVARAIREMVIAGASRHRRCRCQGVALGVLHSSANPSTIARRIFRKCCDVIAKTRPTPVDLFWALERMKSRIRRTHRAIFRPGQDQASPRRGSPAKSISKKKATDEAIGRYGAEFMPAKVKS